MNITKSRKQHKFDQLPDIPPYLKKNFLQHAVVSSFEGLKFWDCISSNKSELFIDNLEKFLSAFKLLEMSCNVLRLLLNLGNFYLVYFIYGISEYFRFSGQWLTHFQLKTHTEQLVTNVLL